MKKFEVAGGLVPGEFDRLQVFFIYLIVIGTEESRGVISLDRPNRQWDYPTAWPPHQMLAWIGLERYGYSEDAARIAYRWLYMYVFCILRVTSY